MSWKREKMQENIIINILGKRDAYVKRLNDIYLSNLNKSKVHLIEGCAKFCGANKVSVEGKDLDLTTNVVAPCPHGQVANEPQLSCLGQSYDNDFFLILNVAVGGTFPGAPDSTSQFPRGMLVDYVRVYQTAAQQAAQ